MGVLVSYTDFINAINNASGTLSAIFPTCSFCFSSDSFTCYNGTHSIAIINDTFDLFPLPGLSIDLDTIKKIEQMQCNDGSTEYEIMLDSGTITLDINTAEGQNHVEQKTA